MLLPQINAGEKGDVAYASAFHESRAGVLEDEPISANASSTVPLTQVMKLAVHDNSSVAVMSEKRNKRMSPRLHVSIFQSIYEPREDRRREGTSNGPLTGWRRARIKAGFPSPPFRHVG